VEEIRAGHVAPDDRLPELPEHYSPFLRLMVDPAAGDREITDAERKLLVDLTVEVVDTISAELVPNFWRPNRQPAQDALNTRIFELLMKSRLMPTPQIEALVDKLMELARANHDRLMKARATSPLCCHFAHSPGPPQQLQTTPACSPTPTYRGC
jgi:type I restriction enzyme, R subunit